MEEDEKDATFNMYALIAFKNRPILLWPAINEADTCTNVWNFFFALLYLFPNSSHAHGGREAKVLLMRDWMRKYQHPNKNEWMNHLFLNQFYDFHKLEQFECFATHLIRAPLFFVFSFSDANDHVDWIHHDVTCPSKSFADTIETASRQSITRETTFGRSDRWQSAAGQTVATTTKYTLW